MVWFSGRWPGFPLLRPCAHPSERVPPSEGPPLRLHRGKQADGKRLAIEGPKVTIGLEGDAGPSPIAVPLFVDVVFNGPAMSTLSFCEEDSEPGEDFFIWPHPTDPGKALFLVDGVAERATGEGTSQSHEGVWETLSKLGDTIAMVARLGMEA